MNEDKDNKASENDEGQQKNEDKDNYLAIGTSLGLCFGAALGTALDRLSVGIALGLCAGVVIGTLLQHRNKNK